MSSTKETSPLLLPHQVEKVELFDCRDEDVAGYIQELVDSCSHLPARKRRFNFMNPEEALNALSIVERYAGHIAARMRTIRALRAFLKTRHTGYELEMQ